MKHNLITRARVENLFGLYTYDLPGESSFTNAAILYGDNGVGKSTLLRLVYHLLSPANDRGHRTALYEADFSLLQVELSNGVVFRAAKKSEEESKILRLEILKNEERIVTWDHLPRRSRDYSFEAETLTVVNGELVRKFQRRKSKGKSRDDGANVQHGNKAYLTALERYAPKLFILNAERRLDSDTVSDPTDEMELRRLMNYDAPKTINELVKRSREIGLTQALSSAARWVSQKAIIGANRGSTNVHSVYVDVVRHLSSPNSKSEDVKPSVATEKLVETLEKIELKMSEHANYELATNLSTEEFRRALTAESSEKSMLAAELLQPYIHSLERRLEAVEPIYKTIDNFVNTLNGFLRDKKITYSLSKGFTILNRLGSPLEASQLSSGEQQLLLLFCYVLTARDEPSVFMIDEPEISLNIKWQRQLVQSLLDITEGSEIQFIFASHSMELLAQHSERVIKLEDGEL